MVLALGAEVTPERLLATPTEALRAAGLSARKVISLQDLSAKIMDGTVAIHGRRLARESDEEIVARLTTVRGIGKWSAEIFAGGPSRSTPEPRAPLSLPDRS